MTPARNFEPFAFPDASAIEAERQRLVRAGLTENEATQLQALRGASQISAVALSSDGGGRYPRFLAWLRAKGLKVAF